jgi:hypothetical protein
VCEICWDGWHDLSFLPSAKDFEAGVTPVSLPAPNFEEISEENLSEMEESEEEAPSHTSEEEEE